MLPMWPLHQLMSMCFLVRLKLMPTAKLLFRLRPLNIGMAIGRLGKPIQPMILI